MKKKVLVFGSTGLLGFSILYYWKKKFQIYANINKSQIYIPGIKYVHILTQSKNFNYDNLLLEVEKFNPKGK